MRNSLKISKKIDDIHHKLSLETFYKEEKEIDDIMERLLQDYKVDIHKSIKLRSNNIRKLKIQKKDRLSSKKRKKFRHR